MSPFKPILIAAFLSSSSLACGSGGSSTSSSTVSAISVTPDPCAVTRTNSVQMKAEATLPNGSKMDVTDSSTWSSSNTNTLTVDSTGVVVGVNAGVTGVTASYSGATGTVDCTVAP